MMRWVTVLLTIAASVGLVAAGKAAKDDADLRAPVRLVVDGDVIPWKRMSVFVLPGESVDIRIDEERLVHEYGLRSEHGVVRQLTPRRWRWEAPDETGMVKLELEPVAAHGDKEKIELRAWVMVPRSRVVNGSLNGVRIGDGTMDDLNGDKRIDREDATVLMGMVVDVERSSHELVGGLGAYPGTRAHGPFVHLDVRGTPARW